MENTHDQQLLAVYRAAQRGIDQRGMKTRDVRALFTDIRNMVLVCSCPSCSNSKDAAIRAHLKDGDNLLVEGSKGE